MLFFTEERQLINAGEMTEIENSACLVWLSGLSTSLQTERLLVQFPVKAHAWAAGPGGGM